MGYEVVAADFNETTEAKEMADYQARADAFSPEDILKCAQVYGVDGVMTAGTDQPVLAVTKAANHLGLSAFLRNETALLVTNKKYMKERFQEKGIPTVRFRVIGKNFPDAQLSGMQPPFVLKPLDSQGQRGIFLVHTVEEVRKKLESVLKYSRSEEILVEEFYANEEITVSGWVDRGTVFILTITDRVTFSPQEHLGVCTSHENPSKYLGEHGDSLKALTRKICTDFHIEEGPVYFQFLHGNEGIKVNEIACRLGGAYEDLTIPYATGADVLRMNIEGCLDPSYYKGELKAAPEAEDSRPYSTRLFFCKEGRVADMTPLEEIRNLPFVLDAGYNVHVGEELPAIENASQRAGFVIVKGETRLEVEENLQQLRRIMSVRDEEGNNLIRTL